MKSLLEKFAYSERNDINSEHLFIAKNNENRKEKGNKTGR